MQGGLVDFAGAAHGPLTHTCLIRYVRDGCRDAEDELVRRHSRSVTALLYLRTRDREVTRELHQETFSAVIIAARAGRIREPDRLGSYVRQTAVNLLRNYRRKQLRSPLIFDDVEIYDEHRGPLREMEAAETARLIRRAIQHLSRSRDQLLLRRYFIDEADKAQICCELDISAVHFDRVLYRAKRRLRQILEQATAMPMPTATP